MMVLRQVIDIEVNLRSGSKLKVKVKPGICIERGRDLYLLGVNALVCFLLTCFGPQLNGFADETKWVINVNNLDPIGLLTK